MSDARRSRGPARLRLRTAAQQDASGIVRIYAPVVRRTHISFETRPPGPAEMRRRIRDTGARMPWLVCVDARERVLGYAYAERLRTRAAYAWCAETTVYVARGSQRRGVARALYAALLALLRRQGYRSAFAGIALPNRASVAFHERLGFRPQGVLQAAGFKRGRWHGVGFWRRALQRLGRPRAAPLPMRRLGRREVATALRRAERFLDQAGGPASR